ncbi:antitoxin from a toxin-antitoxin system [Bacillus phage BCD7]|uniref:Transcriptional regulator AbrB family n=1 Tax=Bacillus phage BCD7 TaxID=1136534 RepID=J9PUL3_9CAUD|nr:antitoxin from a toxin-antitoxin system [Bacillus phage BCD7]AEZ50496.1 transcriptional regulator AbrB family [Bacillus phage BCD7]
MKATGIVRKVDDLGRLIIPKELRDMLDIPFGTNMEFLTETGGTIIIRKYDPIKKCSECGAHDVELVGKSGICKKCISKLAEQE